MQTTTTPSTSPTSAAADPRLAFARAVDLAGETLAAVRDDQSQLPTPCPTMDVATLAGHMATVIVRVGKLAAGDDPFSVPQVTPLTPGRWIAEWADAVAEMRRRWAADEALGRTYVLPWITTDGATLLGMYTSEISVHTWDLATATGQRPAWDDEVLAVASAAIHHSLPSAVRRKEYAAVAEQLPEAARAWFPPFDDAVEVAADAPAIDRLVAWNGRRP